VACAALHSESKGKIVKVVSNGHMIMTYRRVEIKFHNFLSPARNGVLSSVTPWPFSGVGGWVGLIANLNLVAERQVPVSVENRSLAFQIAVSHLTAIPRLSPLRSFVGFKL
jgi:hypothetical protein